MRRSNPECPRNRATLELDLQALRYIYNELKTSGRPPTNLAVARHVGIKTQGGGNQILRRLAERGLLLRSPAELGLHRAIEITLYGFLELGELPVPQLESNRGMAILRLIYEAIVATGKPLPHRLMGHRLGLKLSAVRKTILKLERAYLIERPAIYNGRASQHRGERILQAGADALGLPMPAYQASWDTKRSRRRTLVGKVIHDVVVLRQLPLSYNFIVRLPCQHQTCLTRRQIVSMARAPKCRTCKRETERAAREPAA